MKADSDIGYNSQDPPSGQSRTPSAATALEDSSTSPSPSSPPSSSLSSMTAAATCLRARIRRSRTRRRPSPLQESIRQSYYYRWLTSVKLWLAVMSACFLCGLTLYYLLETTLSWPVTTRTFFDSFHSDWRSSNGEFFTSDAGRQRRRQHQRLSSLFFGPRYHSIQPRGGGTGGPTAAKPTLGQSSSEDDMENPEEMNTYMNINPSLYGWTPNIYPNPLLNPMACKISHLPAEEEANQDDNNGTSVVPPLRLCDPDWVLGFTYLEEVAKQLYNFSNVFASSTGLDSDDGEDLPWDVQVGPSSDRPRARRLQHQHYKHKVNHTKHDAPITFREMMSNQVEQHRRSLGCNKRKLPRVELAVATVRKMNLPAVLREGTYYAYEDEEDMVNDAAQIFARSLHDTWWSLPVSQNCELCDPAEDEDCTGCTTASAADAAAHGVLIFLSIQDRVSFISTGSAISSILPWWRLDHIVASMKPDLRRREYGAALLQAMQDLSYMLATGPPTLQDRFHDFIARFGVVIAFALFTFLFGAWGEYRDRRKRWQYAEQRSRLSSVEKEKARQLQREFKSKVCPICLENFPTTGTTTTTTDGTTANDEISNEDNNSQHSNGCDKLFKPLRQVDSFEIPLYGADGKRIKLLRCGHIFCETCWKSWVHSGCGNPCNCPMCRQDVGKSPKKPTSALMSSRPQPQQQQQQVATSRMMMYDSIQHLQPVALLGNNSLFRGTALLVRGSRSGSGNGETTPLLPGGRRTSSSSSRHPRPETNNDTDEEDDDDESSEHSSLPVQPPPARSSRSQYV